MRGGGCVGVKPGAKVYDTHNWCAKCEDWKIGKPKRCPDCGTLCRWKGRYK